MISSNYCLNKKDKLFKISLFWFCPIRIQTGDTIKLQVLRWKYCSITGSEVPRQ